MQDQLIFEKKNMKNHFILQKRQFQITCGVW